jgi:serine/threonine protein phosphatase PrpC
MSETTVKIIGKPASGPSYDIEGETVKCGKNNEFTVFSSLSQGGAKETFKGTLAIGVAYQQDRAFSGATGATLTPQALKKACKLAAEATKKCIDGSTVSIAALNPDNSLHVANIADSPVMLFSIDQNNHVRGHYLINDPHTASPKIAVKPKLVDVAFRDDGSLDKRFYPISISHTLGDRAYGLDPTADVNSFNIDFPFEQAGKSGRVLLCVASDGICPPEMDGMVCSDDERWIDYYARTLENHLQHDKKASAETLAHVLMREAIACRKLQAEQDNIVIQMAEIPPVRHDTLFMAVCDGHRAADFAGTDFSGNCAQTAAETLHAALSRSKTSALTQATKLNAQQTRIG